MCKIKEKDRKKSFQFQIIKFYDRVKKVLPPSNFVSKDRQEKDKMFLPFGLKTTLVKEVIVTTEKFTTKCYNQYANGFLAIRS
jgi:hypothetical protein